MRAVNLLPQEQKQRRGSNKLALVGVSSSSAVLMLLGAAYLSAHSNVQDHRRALAESKAELAAMPKPKPQNAATAAYDQQLATERIGRLSALSTVLSTRVRWDRLLRELSMVLPDDVWLQQLTASTPVSTAAAVTTGAPAPPTSGGGATTFSIQGNTYTQEGVARLLIHLQLLPDLQNVTLATSALQELQGSTKVQFTINADVKPPEVGS